MRKISKIEPAVQVLKAKKKVAAYARVSMETERLMHSLSAQVSYYSDLIQKNPDWDYAGVYADDGISGTGTEKREEFRRMLTDCEAGIIDIILTKSISRFARNTVDLLETVRHLKSLGVEVWFEKEGIRSMSGDGELMLTILASFAQEESRSISDNVKWGIRKRMEQGIANAHPRVLGYQWDGERYIVKPDEAAVVKRIFQNFLDGKSRLETERELEAEGIRSVKGCVMRDSNLKNILSNITYTGNLLLQKEYISDPIGKHRRKNHGELPQYFVENTHEAIIDKDTFDFVQEEMARRRELGALANKSLNVCCFTGKIKCPHCGLSYMHNRRMRDGHYSDYWVCGSKKKKGNSCPVKGSINHKNLEKACAAVLGLEEFDEEVFLEEVDHIEVPEPYTLDFFLKDGSTVRRGCRNTGHKDCWTPEYRARASAQRLRYGTKPKNGTCFTGRIKCAVCGKNYRHQERRRGSEKERCWVYACPTAAKCGCHSITEEELKSLSAEALGLVEFDADAFSERVDRVVLEADGKVTFWFKDGTFFETKYHNQRRGHKHTEAYKEHMRQVMKGKWTDERRQKMSEDMKKLRSEKYWASKRK